MNKKQTKTDNPRLKILSLFSGCGGMDLSFEGGFHVLRKSINSKIHPDWLTSKQKNSDWVKLPRKRFETVFANDINAAAKASWVPYFSKNKNNATKFHLSSIVDLVKAQKKGNYVFPEADIVTGGFPCQDFRRSQGVKSPLDCII